MILQKLSMLSMLGILSFEDMKNKKIHTWWLAFFAMEGILLHIFLLQDPFSGFIYSIIPGTAMLLVSFVTHGKIGEGDAILMIIEGIFLGISAAVRMMLYAFFLSFGYAVFLFVAKKKDKNYEIPFVPFLLLAFLMELL